jgi:hypothetical protein
MSKATDIWGWDTTPAVGRYVKPDGWAWGRKLEAGDSFSTFRLPVNDLGPIKSIATEIQVTGRTLQRIAGLRVVRVKIIFPGDCAPDTVTGGWMEIPW